MFAIGDYVVHGNNGVCKVEEVQILDGMGANQKMYYTLVPLYASGSKFFVPTDSKKVVTRSVMTKQQVEQLIAEWNDIETLWVDNDKNREEIYKEALRSCDFRQWAKLMKTSYQRNQARLKRGKKVTASDERYLHMAEDNLFGELAVPLCMTKSEAESYFLSHIRSE